LALYLLFSVSRLILTRAIFHVKHTRLILSGIDLAIKKAGNMPAFLIEEGFLELSNSGRENHEYAI